MANPNNEHIPSPDQRKQVETLIAYGVPQEVIADMIGIHVQTLRKHYEAEIKVAAWKANAKVVESLFGQCVKPPTAGADWKPNITALIWWTKCRAGWKESIDLNVPGGIDHRHTGAVAVATPEQLAAMTDEQLANMVRGAISESSVGGAGLNGHGVNGHAYGNGAGIDAAPSGPGAGTEGEA